MRVFVIADASKRKAEPIGALAWRPCPESDQGTFALEVSSSCGAAHLPLSLSFCANREGRRATPEESEDWVRSRIVPESRHNIAEVLRANGLARYDEVGLLASSQGRSSDDDLLTYEVDVPQEFVGEPAAASDLEPAAGGLDAQLPPFADRVIAAVRRQRAGTEVAYAFVGLDGGADDDARAAAPDPNARPSTESAPNAAKRIGSLIRAERLAQGLTQKQLAARAGITQTVLSRTESGAGNPTLALLEEIAAALGMQLGIHLVTGDGGLSHPLVTGDGGSSHPPSCDTFALLRE